MAATLLGKHIELMQQEYAEGSTIEELAEKFKVDITKVKRHVLNEGVVGRVRSENREQSYRENLSWAIKSAGEFLRTKRKPKVCPNDAAYFLFCQAMKEPKDFLQRVSQVETKTEDTSDRESRISTKRTLDEIDSFLERINATKKE